jgi:hypothetical protein
MKAKKPSTHPPLGSRTILLDEADVWCVMAAMCVMLTVMAHTVVVVLHLMCQLQLLMMFLQRTMPWISSSSNLIN